MRPRRRRSSSGRRAVSTYPRTLALCVLGAGPRAARGPDVLPAARRGACSCRADRRAAAPRPRRRCRGRSRLAQGRPRGRSRGDSEGARCSPPGRQRATTWHASRRGAGVPASRSRRTRLSGGPYALELAGDAAAAAARWSELGRPYEAALALADVGTGQMLRESLEQLQSTRRTTRGHHRLAAPARSSVRATSRAVRGRSTRAERGLLTPREVDVLKLVSEGLRNADIAAAAVRLTTDRRPPRLGDPAQARRSHRGEAVAAAVRGSAPPRTVARARNLGITPIRTSTAVLPSFSSIDERRNRWTRT